MIVYNTVEGRVQVVQKGYHLEGKNRVILTVKQQRRVKQGNIHCDTEEKGNTGLY